MINKTEIFKKKAIAIHGDLYDMSNVVYLKNNVKVSVICNIHGSFFITPNNFLSGVGCKKCAIEKRSNSRKTGADGFILKAKVIHGDRYSYVNSIYVNSNTKISIYCNVCKSSFLQIPSGHLRGKGCPNCRALKISLSKTSNTEEFIKKANLVHGLGKYDYSKSNYISNSTLIKIICNKCNNHFMQKPNHHISSISGCPKCNVFSSHGADCIESFLIKNGISYEKEKRYISCRNKRPLPFDFYLIDYNLLIEYDGEQHFKNIEMIGREDSLDSIKFNDSIKDSWCKNNEIELLRIPYWEFKNIDNILNIFITKNKKNESSKRKV